MKYTDDQIFGRLRALPSFQYVPGGYWAVAVRSAADLTDSYDDKFYLYQGDRFVLATSCTTNPGRPALMGGWRRYNKVGAALIKADEWYYDAFAPGLHNGKMRALRQIGDMKYYRDGDGDGKSEEIGEMTVGVYNTNIHFCSYGVFDRIRQAVVSTRVGEWSYGCVVLNVKADYERLITLVAGQKRFTFALLKQF